MSNQWYYSKKGQRIGPVSEEQINLLAQSGEIQPTDMVWAKGMTAWIPAETVQGLRFATTSDKAPDPTQTERWYYVKGDKKHGPVTAVTLKELATSWQLSPNDLVWKVGMAQWTEGKNVKGLFPIPKTPSIQIPPPLPPNTSNPEPPTLPQLSIQPDLQSLSLKNKEQQRQRNHRIIVLGLVIAAIVAAVGSLTYYLPGGLKDTLKEREEFLKASEEGHKNIMNNIDENKSDAQTDYSTGQSNTGNRSRSMDNSISLADYERVKVGMTQSQVEAILGPGREASSVEILGVSNKNIEYKIENNYVSITFTDGRVSTKMKIPMP